MKFNQLSRQNRIFRWSLVSLCFALLIGFSGCVAAPLASQTTAVTEQTAIAATAATPVVNHGAIAQANSVNAPADQPTVATVEDMVSGDLLCYVTLVDDQGSRYENIGATFEVCRPEAFLNQRVNLAYTEASVSDCEGIEPCDRSRLTTLISEMTVVSQAASAPPEVELIGGDGSTASYRMTINNPGDIVFVYCPENYAPQLGYLRNVEALQCEPL
jgi:hypothetical protein